MAGLLSPAFLLIFASTFALFSAVGAVVPVLPRYVEGPLGGSDVAVGFVVGMFFLSSVASRPLAGRLGDRRGRRLLLAGGGAITALAVATFDFVPGIGGLALARFVQGVGESAFYVGAASAVTDLVPAHRRGEAISYFSAALYSGLAIGPMIGEAVFAHSHYGRVWALAATLAAVGAATGLAVSDRRPVPANGGASGEWADDQNARRDGRPPGPGGHESAEALRSSWPHEGRTSGPDKADLAAPLGPAGIGTRGKFIHPAALVPGSIFGLGTFGYAAFAAFTPLYAKDLGLSGSGPLFAVYATVTLVGRILGARLPDRLGPAVTARWALATMALGMAVLGGWRQPAGLWVGTIVFAAGNTYLFPALLNLALAAAPEDERGAVVGTQVAFFDLGQGAGAVTLGPLVGLIGYPGAYLAGAVAATLGLGLLQWHRRSGVPAVASLP